VILSVSSITYASGMMGERWAACVSIRLAAWGKFIRKMTSGKCKETLSYVYVETVPQTTMGKRQTRSDHKNENERVINMQSIHQPWV